MKEQLAAVIGWYNSKNSLAHITLNEFETDARELDNIRKHLMAICRYLHPEPTRFNRFDTFPNGAFFLAPDESCKEQLKAIMKEFHQGFKYKTEIKSSEPHISIGRRLKPEQITKAYALFNTPALSFLCDRIALRRFNPERKQFDIVEEFIFGGEMKEGVQGKLF
ncbi:2'-5' RNA ligase family protein [Flavobacterium amniphilum]|nr:2'-5' RNA ligase family protein [Flavobacterium amniphilum]MCL9807024.1 2'-5' RNA ligase family protein [Flavobacterium amniphilum]